MRMSRMPSLSYVDHHQSGNGIQRPAAQSERARRFELLTSSLGSWHSTTELRPQITRLTELPPSCLSCGCQARCQDTRCRSPASKPKILRNLRVASPPKKDHSDFIRNCSRPCAAGKAKCWRVLSECFAKTDFKGGNFKALSITRIVLWRCRRTKSDGSPTNATGLSLLERHRDRRLKSRPLCATHPSHGGVDTTLALRITTLLHRPEFVIIPER